MKSIFLRQSDDPQQDEEAGAIRGFTQTKARWQASAALLQANDHGSREEQEYLTHFRSLAVLTRAIPRSSGNRELRVRRLIDYHTIQGTMRASETENPNAVLTHRQYLTDAFFRVMLVIRQVTTNGHESRRLPLRPRIKVYKISDGYDERRGYWVLGIYL